MAENRNETREMRYNRFWLGVAVGVSAMALVFGPRPSSGPDRSGTSEQSTDVTPADSQPNQCPKSNVDFSKHYDGSVTEYAITHSELNTYSDLLRNAQTFEESTDILNQVFSRWDYDVHIGEVPVLSSSDLETRGNDIEHTPDLITQELVNISSIHILESLSQSPATLLELTRDTDLYLTIGALSEEGGYSGLYGRDENNRPFMIVGVGPYDPSGDIFEHEVTHNLFYRLCGDGIGHNDTEIAALNPVGWQYTRLHQPDSYWVDITANAYGATNSTEDTAVNFPRLLRAPLRYLCPEISSPSAELTPVCKKLELLIERVAARSPETAEYLVG